jgi:tRNA threonylcarbamoyladenosine biosynthesis protein TsaB
MTRAARILALDTATEACSAALSGDGTIRARYEEIGRGHAERILAMVDELLVEAGWRLADLDAIAFGRGPGGFTGVRLAASVTQGMAFGAGLRVVPISNLAALAAQAFEQHPAALQCWAGTDARMKEIYGGVYARAPFGGVVLRGEERVAPIAAIESDFGSLSESADRCVAIGRALRAYPEAARVAAQRCQHLLPDALPAARHIAELALLEWAAGRSVAPELAVPVYLRDDVAQVPVTSAQ